MTSRIRHFYPSLKGVAVLAALIVVIAFLVTLTGSRSYERIATTLFISIIVAVGLQIFMGNSGVMNFGFIAFMAIGAYAAAILTTPAVTKMAAIPDAPLGLDEVELSFWAGAAVALLVTTVFGIVTGLILARAGGIPAAIAALAMLVIVHVVLLNWVSLTGGARAWVGVPIRTNMTYAVIGAIAAILVARVFRDSRLGLRLRASREDPIAAAGTGVSIASVRLVAWILSAFIIGAGGVLMAHYLGSFNTDTFYLSRTFLILAMLLLGGQGNVSGPVVGALLVTVGWEVMRSLESGPTVVGLELPELFGLPQLFLGALIIITMKFRPEGLLGNLELDEHLRQWLRRLRPARSDQLGASAADAGDSSQAHV